jgi:hypothetical protein
MFSGRMQRDLEAFDQDAYLTSRQKGANVKSMKRTARSLVAFSLIFLFASAVLCATLAAPGQYFGSISGCSHIPSGTAMEGCDLPRYLGSSASSNDRLAQSLLGSARLNDSLKNALGLAFVSSVNLSLDLTPPGIREWRSVTVAESGKVSIRLFNSILNL